MVFANQLHTPVYPTPAKKVKLSVKNYILHSWCRISDPNTQGKNILWFLGASACGLVFRIFLQPMELAVMLLSEKIGKLGQWINTYFGFVLLIKKKKKSLEKMSPFLLFWLKTVQRKQVLVHSCPWAQLRVEQTPVKSRRKLATPPSMFLSREASPALSALGETLREGGSFALFLYLPVCTHSAEERRYWTFWSQEYTRGPEHLQPLSVLNTSFQAKGSWQRPGGRQAGRRLQHLLPEMPASGLKCNDQLATPWAAWWTHTPWALWVALP